MSTVIFVYLIVHCVFHSRCFLLGINVENKKSSYFVPIQLAIYLLLSQNFLFPNLPVLYLLGSWLMAWVGHWSLLRNLYIYSCLGSLFVTHKINDEIHHLLFGEISALHCVTRPLPSTFSFHPHIDLIQRHTKLRLFFLLQLVIKGPTDSHRCNLGQRLPVHEAYLCPLVLLLLVDIKQHWPILPLEIPHSLKFLYSLLDQASLSATLSLLVVMVTVAFWLLVAELH